MPQLTTRRRLAAAACATGLVAGLSTIAATGPAHADSGLTIVYKAQGQSTLAKTGSTLKLGPSNLTATLNPADGSFTGHLPLPPTSTTFKILGLIPVSATVNFIEAAPVTGKLVTTGGKQFVQSTATYTIRLTDVKAAGLPTFQGDSCQTVTPVSIPANSPRSKPFNLTSGGRLTGTYTLGDFANCGLTTGLINLLVPGPGNTVGINVRNGQIQQ